MVPYSPETDSKTVEIPGNNDSLYMRYTQK